MEQSARQPPRLRDPEFAGLSVGAILDATIDAIIAIDRDGLVREWNRSAEELFGYPRDEVLGRELAELIIPPGLRERHRAGLAHFMLTGEGPILRQRVEVPARRAGGDTFSAELTVIPLTTEQGPLFIGSVRDISAQRQAERRLAAQYTVNRILADAATIDDATGEIIRALCASLDWDAGMIWAVDDEAQLLRCLALWHQPEHALSAFLELSRQSTFDKGVGLPGRVWASAEPSWIRNIEEDDNFPRVAAARAGGLHGALAFPIVSRGVLLGVAEFFSREIRPPDAEMLATLGTLGSQIGQFVERKQTEQALTGVRRELSDRLADINRLHAVSARLTLQEDLTPLLHEVLSAVAGLQDADMGVLMLYDPARDDLYPVASVGFSDDYLAQVGRVPRGAGACGQALAERRPVAIRDVSREPHFAPFLAPARLAGYRAVYSTPLLTLGGDVVGTLATYFRMPHVPTARERSLAELYAHQAAELVETNRLYREAADAVREREEFISTAAHELKTPLTTIKGYSQILRHQVQRPALDQPRLALLVEQLGEQVSRMEALVAELLDISRIQQGHLELRREPLDLCALARATLARFEHAPERRPDHRLEIQAPDTLQGWWDPIRLDQVLTNLLSNALKYSPEGGTVRLRVQRRQAFAEIQVSDQGIGIPHRERARIFQPFARSETTSRAITGVGLGLHICAQIVKRHGGSITVESEPGQGSTFTVRLPLGESLQDAKGRAAN